MKKAFIFDFDDTLATTDARIIVRRDEGDKGISESLILEKISPATYNTYELRPGYFFDFSEFRLDKFILNANPTKLMDLAEEVYSEGHPVYILTARNNVVCGAIASYLARFNIVAKAIHAVGSGADVNIAEEKRKVLETLIQVFDCVYFYDDCLENCEAASSVSSSVKVFLV
jgi:phosphoserine phosphatase